MELYDKLKQITNYESICVIGHTSPDADAFASMVVFKNFLTNHFNLGKVDLFAECSKIQTQYKTLLGTNRLNPKPTKYEVAIMMDCPNIERLGEYQELFDNAELKIVIDHHQTNLFQGNINIVEKQSSTCEIVYSILEYYAYNLSQTDMENIYAGIITDTNNFTVGNFNEKTFTIVSNIIDSIDHELIYNQFFRNNSLKNMQLLATAINNISTINNEEIIISHISREEADQLNAKFDDFIGIINKLATINNCKLACFIYPKGENYYVSMRAKKGLKVSHIAKANGGGGHDGAAAYISNLPIEKVKEKILKDFTSML